MNSGFDKIYQYRVDGDSGNPSHLTFDARKIIEVSLKK